MELVGPRWSRLVWVVRHGESTWNALGRMQRQNPYPPLTAKGLAQAYGAGHRLRDHQIARVLSSDAVRAKQTGQAIATVLGVELLVDGRLRERGWGAGLHPVSTRSPVVERLEDPTERVYAVLEDIAGLPGPTVVVTHGDIVCAMRNILAPHDVSIPPWTSGTEVPNGAVVAMKLDRLRVRR